jgi:hypothetical protein
MCRTMIGPHLLDHLSPLSDGGNQGITRALMCDAFITSIALLVLKIQHHRICQQTPRVAVDQFVVVEEETDIP